MVCGRGGAATRPALEAAGGYAVLCALSAASRVVPALFGLVIVLGIAGPWGWDRLRQERSGPGFTRRNLPGALGWGVGSGAAFGLYTWAVFGRQAPAPPLLALQLAIALPVWLLVMSPFQEFSFRGWLQPRLQTAFGRWPGLLLASAAFAGWHFFPPLEGTMTSTLPITTPLGIASAVALGLLMGYVYDRTGNMVPPWLGHALAGLALVLTGTMTFLTYNP